MTTHPMPPQLLDARARPADASSSALVITASLASLAEVHYAVFPINATGTPPEVGGLRFDDAEEKREGSTDGGKGDVGHGRKWGCGDVYGVGGEKREATALNDTLGLVASGVVPSAATAELLRSAAAEKETGTKPASIGSAPPADGKSTKPASSRVLEGDALEVVFRVDGLQPAQPYSVCLFTETPGSNGYVYFRPSEKTIEAPKGVIFG